MCFSLCSAALFAHIRGETLAKTGERTNGFRVESKPNFSQSGSLTLPGSDKPGLRHYREETGGLHSHGHRAGQRKLPTVEYDEEESK